MIRLKDVGKTYDQGTREITALKGLSLSIEKGEFLCIMGPSGSGKSTLLNLIGGIDQPSTGEIFIDGIPLHRLSDNDLTLIRLKRVGFVFQFFNLLPMLTAMENVGLPLLIDGRPHAEMVRKAGFLLEQMGLGSRATHLPEQLSGGEQQRVAICRALVADPELLLADEPTGNLDSHVSEDILSLLKSLNENGQTIVMVTHNPTAAAYGSRIIFLRDGSLSADTPVAESGA